MNDQSHTTLLTALAAVLAVLVTALTAVLAALETVLTALLTALVAFLIKLLLWTKYRVIMIRTKAIKFFPILINYEIIYLGLHLNKNFMKRKIKSLNK